MATSYQDRCAQKRADQLSLIPPEWRLHPVPSIESAPNALAYIHRILSPEELALTEETDIAVLLRKLSSGELSSLKLTRVFAKRAALAHQLITCCTEIFFEQAFAVAQELDDYLAKTGKTVGPLHGLPVSIKDLFSVEGVDTSIGKSPSSFLSIYEENTYFFMYRYCMYAHTDNNQIQAGSASPTTQQKQIKP
jgi:amidase